MRLPWPASRRGFLVGAAATTVTSDAFAAAESVPFLVVGDWGEHSAGQVAVAAAMGDVANQIRSQFVISTGDNFYSRGVASVSDPQWQTTFESAFSAPSLQTSWYAVLGNHDYRGSVAAEVHYSDRSDRWRMPSRYWRQDIAFGDETISFFMLDTYPLTHMSALRSHVPIVGDASEAHQQLRWLETELSASQSRWKFAVGHHPILSSGMHGGSPPLYDHLRPLFQNFGVRAYFNGHDHNLEHLSEGALDYVCSGAGSEYRPLRTSLPQSNFSYSGYGFASCQLRPSGLSIRFHDQTGAELYRAEIV